MKLITHIKDLLPESLYEVESVRQYEARVIAEEVSGHTYTELLTNDFELNEKQLASLEKIILERSTGKPLAYVLNSAPFRELDLYVDQRVLIPRPETELLVEEVLKQIEQIDTPLVLDVGTGSGAIALSIAQEHKTAEVVGIDISQDAIDVANLNMSAVGFAASRVSFCRVQPCKRLFDEISSLQGSTLQMFDVIVSNPPYIGEDERDDLPSQVLDFEPEMALFADEDGFMIYRQIIEQSKSILKENGKIIFEISPRHVKEIESTAKENGFSSVQIIKDLTGRERIAVIA